MHVPRWILLAAAAVVIGVGTFLRLQTPRPDGRFDVLGEAALLEPAVVGETGGAVRPADG